MFTISPYFVMNDILVSWQDSPTLTGSGIRLHLVLDHRNNFGFILDILPCEIKPFLVEPHDGHFPKSDLAMMVFSISLVPS
jgi:hypothetical protein